MLSVHQYHHHQPFAPIPSTHASSTRRHNKLIVERGRSRTVSQVALARKKSEERRKRAAITAAQLAQQACSSSSRVTFSQASNPCASSQHNTTPALLEDHGPVASSSSCRLPSPPAPPREPVYGSGQPVHVSNSVAEDSEPRQDRCVISGSTNPPYSVPEASSLFCDDEDPSDSVDSLSLQEQMQQAYAACQTTCFPSPGKKHCRCPNMHRARVLYLKTQGIDVTSDDDPRIDKVCDDDFEFVPGGEVVLDEETLAAIKEERERREKEMEARRCRVNGQERVLGSNGAGVTKSFAQRYEQDSYRWQTSQALEFDTKGGCHLLSRIAELPRQHNGPVYSCDLFPSRIEQFPTFNPIYQADMTDARPCQVSLREVVRSLHGPLFPDHEPQRRRSPSQERCLNLLLEPFQWQDYERRSVRNGQFRRVPEGDTACIACSVSSDSTISRTNSWASAASGATTSTCITSPSSSPRSDKMHLPSVVDVKALRKELVHSCRAYRRSRLAHVRLSETPLHLDGDRREQELPGPANDRPLHKRKEEKVASALVTRVRQSVHGLMDFASRMQQSYLRSIQFAVSLQPDMFILPSEDLARTHSGRQPSNPSGYRASPRDVQCLAPRSVSRPTRDLNLPSDLNIPLVTLRFDPDCPDPPHVFAPLAFIPPSPLRPRETPITPEWRLRPVANPCLLRLKAHARRLSEKGIPWEGRAHPGSFGCGRERLTGVAFEGLGGSRLAFEAK